MANSDIDSSQCAAEWRVDDRKTSHKSTTVAKGIVSKLECGFRAISSKFFGAEYNFLGMQIKLKCKKVNVDTIECLMKASTDFGEKGFSSVVTLEKSHLKNGSKISNCR